MNKKIFNETDKKIAETANFICDYCKDNSISLEILDNAINIVKDVYHKDAVIHRIIKKEIDLAYLDILDTLKKQIPQTK